MSPSMFQWIPTLLVLATLNIGMASEPVVHELHSSRQASATTVRVLLPDMTPKDD